MYGKESVIHVGHKTLTSLKRHEVIAPLQMKESVVLLESNIASSLMSPPELLINYQIPIKIEERGHRNRGLKEELST